MKIELLNAILDCEMNYEIYQNSFSPIYSNFGLGIDGKFSGINSLFLHYNRTTRTLFEPLLTLQGDINEYIPRAESVKIKTEKAVCEIAFYDTDSILIHCKTDASINLFGKNNLWVALKDENTVILQGYAPNGDDRDPDKEVSVMTGLRVLKGSFSHEKNTVVMPENGEILLALSFDVLTIDIKKILRKLNYAPDCIEDAKQATQNWVCETVNDLDISFKSEKEKTVFVKAVITLIFNLAKAPGNLEGFISAFPNRGGYPTHFMWDSCFQNLAYEIMNTSIARDSLLLLAKNIRSDGKIPQFLCSTWGRPHDAQPALLGWAAKRYYEKTKDLDFVKEIFKPLEKNNKWWLTQRMTRFGIIKCADGLETGQDNSPRFDNGSVLAVDMNSYLLNQIKVTSEFAAILGFSENAGYWKRQAEKLNGNMIKYLYDKNKNMFFDADAETGEKQSLLTSSGFIPLWAGITLPKEKAKEMIKNYLLNENYFYGNIPFPSVAYTENVYDCADWWRGPTWMPEAWLMLEVLKNYGFNEEYENSVKRLFDILIKDGKLHELFNSQTGEGMGFIEQSWTAAIFIKIYTFMNA